MRILALVLLFTLAPHAARATPSDFQFSSVPVVAIAQTIATLGKFNVLVAPELQERSMDYARKQVEPSDALEDVAKAVGGSLMKVPGITTALYVLTATPLPPDLAPPAGAATDGSLTDFNFKAVELKNIVQTLAVLGKFTATLGPSVPDSTLTLALKQIEPGLALFWVAAVSGLQLQRTEQGGQAVYTLTR